MPKLILALLLSVTGFGLAWYVFNDRGADPVTPAQSVTPDKAVLAPAAPDHINELTILLERNDFAAVQQHYETLTLQSSDAEAALARTEILSHASSLIEDQQFSFAAQLLQHFLLAAYRDVEARYLLASAFHGQQDFNAVIDQLYEARGHAYRPAMRARIAARIQTIVVELTLLLKSKDDQYALLDLYQHLIQLQPDHAPWFIELATAQSALDDVQAARRSLQLVVQDPDVGERAQMMLAELDTSLGVVQDLGPGDSVAENAGIPLHRSGNHFIVDARPAYGQIVRLLIDTGASLTIFTPDALDRRGIRYRDTGRAANLSTANGTIQAPVYMLETLAVGDWQVDQLEIGVLALAGSSGVDGLLGMNFLNHFRFFIDQNEALLHLSAE